MKPARAHSAWRRFAIVAATLLVLLGLFLVEEHVRGRVLLNAYVEEMRARGERFSVAELVPAPPEPQDNRAGLLMAGIGQLTFGQIIPDPLPGAMRFVAPGRARALTVEAAWAFTDPRRFVPTNGAVRRYSSTNLALQTNSPAIPLRRDRNTARPATLATVDELRADLATVSNALAVVHEALERPACDFALPYSQGFNVRVPHLVQMKRTAHWLRGASLAAVLQTNFPAATGHLVDLARLGHSLTNEPLMISQLVGTAMTQIGCAATWEALQVDGWTEEQLQRIQEAWQPGNAAAAMARSYEMERAMGVEFIDHAAERPDLVAAFLPGQNMPAPTGIAIANLGDLGDLVTAFGQSVVKFFSESVYYPVWRFAWKDQDKLNLLKYWQPYVTELRAQAVQNDWRGVRSSTNEVSAEEIFAFDDPEHRFRGSDFYDRCRYLVSSLLTSSERKPSVKALQAETVRQLTTTACALHRYRLRKGSWPERLEQLRPQFLSEIPRDSFDGNPLRYRRNTDGTFLLYSIGADLNDDGGDPAPENPKSNPQLLYGRDLVWPRLATQKEITAHDSKHK